MPLSIRNKETVALAREVAARTGRTVTRTIHEALALFGMVVAPLTSPMILAAPQAYERYGKGRHHAGLNMGDCLSYAAARTLGLPLLYKGDDFARTDIPSALPA